MEKVVRLRKNRISVYLIIAVILIIAVAAGIYFWSNGRNKEPSRGTYVIEYNDLTCYRNHRFRIRAENMEHVLESLKLEAGDMPPPETLIPTRHLRGGGYLYSRYREKVLSY